LRCVDCLRVPVLQVAVGDVGARERAGDARVELNVDAGAVKACDCSAVAVDHLQVAIVEAADDAVAGFEMVGAAELVSDLDRWIRPGLALTGSV